MSLSIGPVDFNLVTLQKTKHELSYILIEGTLKPMLNFPRLIENSYKSSAQGPTDHSSHYVANAACT